jgi:hypothetical protein
MNRLFLPISLSIILSSFNPVLADPVPGALDLGAWNLETLKSATAVHLTTTDAPDSGPSPSVGVKIARSDTYFGAVSENGEGTLADERQRQLSNRCSVRGKIMIHR